MHTLRIIARAQSHKKELKSRLKSWPRAVLFNSLCLDTILLSYTQSKKCGFSVPNYGNTTCMYREISKVFLRGHRFWQWKWPQKAGSPKSELAFIINYHKTAWSSGLKSSQVPFKTGLTVYIFAQVVYEADDTCRRSTSMTCSTPMPCVLFVLSPWSQALWIDFSISNSPPPPTLCMCKRLQVENTLQSSSSRSPWGGSIYK